MVLKLPKSIDCALPLLQPWGLVRLLGIPLLFLELKRLLLLFVLQLLGRLRRTCLFTSGGERTGGANPGSSNRTDSNSTQASTFE